MRGELTIAMSDSERGEQVEEAAREGSARNSAPASANSLRRCPSGSKSISQRLSSGVKLAAGTKVLGDALRKTGTACRGGATSAASHAFGMFGAGRRESVKEEDVVLRFFRACEDGDYEDVLDILSGEEDRPAAMKVINAQDAEGRTGLARAAEANHSLTALLLIRLGARVDIHDIRNKISLTYAVQRRNLTLVLAMLSALCGLAGTARRKVDAHLTRREGTQLYAILGEMDAVKVGRAASLMFLVNPENAILTLVRGSTAATDKAILVKGRSPSRFDELERAARLLDKAIAALLHHLPMLIIPRTREEIEEIEERTLQAEHARKETLKMATSPKKGGPPSPRMSVAGSMAAGLAAVSEEGKKAVYSRRELIQCLLKNSQVIELAVRYEYKAFFALPAIMNYLEDKWGGALVERQREIDEQLRQKDKIHETRAFAKGIHVGSRVKHEKHGEGTCVARLKDGRLHVEFDGGETHNYTTQSVMTKLRLLEMDEQERDEDEDPGVGATELAAAFPRFLVQGVVLWLPLAIYPPLADWLRKKAGTRYLLEVPSLKFFSSFVSDVVFFVSLTFLAQPKYYTLLGWKPWLGDETLTRFAPAHFVLALGICLNEWRQMALSKREVLYEYAEVVGKTRLTSCSGLFLVVSATVDLLYELGRIDVLEFCDLYGPLFACASLLNFILTNDDMLPQFLSVALLLLGVRLLRVVTMMPTLGPLILMIDKMFYDVFTWLIVQSTFMIGFASAFYALAGDPDTFHQEGRDFNHLDHDDLCDLIRLSDHQSLDEDIFIGSVKAWGKGFLMLIESMLLQEAPLACMREHSANAAVAEFLLMMFQLFTAILMLNMLIAMMAKTFDRIHSETAINFNFLRAQTITTWIEQHPSPPPFNLLAAMYAPIKLVKSFVGQRIIERDNETAKELGVATSEKRGAPPPAHFLLTNDFQDEQHVRELARFVSHFVREAEEDRVEKIEAERTARLERIESALEHVIAKTEDAFRFLKGYAGSVDGYRPQPEPGTGGEVGQQPPEDGRQQDDASGSATAPSPATVLAPAEARVLPPVSEEEKLWGEPPPRQRARRRSTRGGSSRGGSSQGGSSSRFTPASSDVTLTSLATLSAYYKT